MHDPALILVVDDKHENIEILTLRLEAQGYRIVAARDGEEALDLCRSELPDLVLLDIMMPKLDGLAVVREIKSDERTRDIPVILVTAKSDVRDVVAGLDAGGDDYLSKPFDHAALLARVRSMLRNKRLADQVRAQSAELARQSAALAEVNRTLEERVAIQIAELERANRLKRFLPPQVAALVVESDDSNRILESHRREVSVVFCDIRGFTPFAETTEPEEVMAVLRAYHAALGALIHKHEGTLERFMGDGLMVIFNDPIRCADHAERALRLAVDMRGAVEQLSAEWARRGYELGFGVGIALGYATIGCIGFDGRLDYSAIGSIPNLAARLCSKAKNQQILVSQRFAAAIEDKAVLAPVGSLELKGFHRPFLTFEVAGWKE